MASSLESGLCLPEELLVLRRVLTPSRPAASSSSASALFKSDTLPLMLSAALDRVRGRLLGAVLPSFFLCLTADVMLCAAESAASSPEASREEGWRRSALFAAVVLSRVEARLRLPDPDDEGEDIPRAARP